MGRIGLTQRSGRWCVEYFVGDQYAVKQKKVFFPLNSGSEALETCTYLKIVARELFIVA